jgi:hypothetical protein
MGDDDSDKENMHPNNTPQPTLPTRPRHTTDPSFWATPSARRPMGNLRGNSTDAKAAGTNGVETPRTGTARSNNGMEEDEGGGRATRGRGGDNGGQR